MFKPVFNITTQIAQLLIKIEQIKQEIQYLPITPTVLSSLRESARLNTTHYSTFIEGNQLTIQQVENVIKLGSAFPGRKRDQDEILGYYAALETIKKLSDIHKPLTQTDLQYIHALVVGCGKIKIKPTPYRDGQNVIYDGKSKNIVYLPPEAHDVKQLMEDLIEWLMHAEQTDFPCPLRAAIAHYQFATIHPYYDGNGRTARLLATTVLHRGGYDLKGLYSLEEYYAKNLSAYYNAISVGPSHNYYLGRAEADITPWLEYFCHGMVDSFEKVKMHALLAYNKGFEDQSKAIRDLDARQQAVLALFQKSKTVTSKDIQTFFALSARAARALCQKWLHDGFLVLKDPAKKNRSYELKPDLNKKLF